MSREGRKRVTFRTVKTITTTIIIAALAGGAFEIWRTWYQTPQLLAAPVDGQPVKTIAVESDGVLGQPWVERVLALPRNIGLMELDLYALRTRLMASGQVASAALTREFPDTLKVVLAERSPIVRLRAQIGAEPERDFLVARDGTVFLGEGYEKDLTDSLPWLGGVRLVREGNGFQPLAGMDRLGDLLVTAITNVPNRYATWRVVSMSRYPADGVIIVQSSDGAEIVFGTREDFYTQIARLDLILERTEAPGGEPIRSVNLAIGPTHVPVAMKPSANAIVGGAERATPFPRGNPSSRKREL